MLNLLLQLWNVSSYTMVNDELNTKLLEIVTDIQTNATAAKSVLMTEIPEVVTQWMNYELYLSIFWLTISVIVLSFNLLFYLFKDRSTYDDEKLCLYVIFTSISTIWFIVVACMQISEITQIILTPKIWIIEHLKDIISIIKG